jgi:tRNA threonylcarbamoyl adenosine modification protein (Sua5/YciO/YrdC/YwlC family)
VTPIEDAAAAAGRGELIVFPTDTVYGIGTRPDAPQATARLFEAKGRPRDLTLPVLVPSLEAAREVGRFDERAGRLASACWPGPLTLILPRTRTSGPWDLGGDAETIGVRVPRHQLALAVLVAAGPLAVTSANRSGKPPARTCDELESAFGDLIAVYLCQEEPVRGAASTVIDLTHDEMRLIRAGELELEELERLLGSDDPLLDSPPSGSPERG